MSGAIGATTSAGKKQYPGFTAKPFEQQTISADGTTVVSVYYDRNAYTVTFNANGGTGSMPNQTFYYDIAQNLTHNAFSYPGYTFDGWATSATGKSTYSDVSEFSIAGQTPANVTLYATWFYNYIVVTAQTAGDIDLAGASGEWTIKVTGNISQSTLLVLVDKMKASKASFNLDLSETTGLTAIGPTGDGTTSVFDNCPLRSLVLPKTLEIIGNYTFYKCAITTVMIPSSVKTIGDYAFRYSNLETLEIDGCETIGTYAFANCENLKNIVLKNIVTIKSDAFYKCTSLELLEIDGVETIGTSTFEYCENLKTIELNNITAIGSSAFTNCASLAASVTIKSVNSIGEKVFSLCPGLTSVTMESVKSIGNYAFLSCTSLISVTMKSVDSIGYDAFWNCTGLATVAMESVGSIGVFAFLDCISLVEIIIDAESISRSAFSGCTSLTSVVIGKNVKSLDNTDVGCFYNCNNLISVRFEDTANWYSKEWLLGSISSALDVTNAATNASNLRNFCGYLWYKE